MQDCLFVSIHHQSWSIQEQLMKNARRRKNQKYNELFCHQKKASYIETSALNDGNNFHQDPRSLIRLGGQWNLHQRSKILCHEKVHQQQRLEGVFKIRQSNYSKKVEIMAMRFKTKFINGQCHEYFSYKNNSTKKHIKNQTRRNQTILIDHKWIKWKPACFPFVLVHNCRLYTYYKHNVLFAILKTIVLKRKTIDNDQWRCNHNFWSTRLFIRSDYNWYLIKMQIYFFKALFPKWLNWQPTHHMELLLLTKANFYQPFLLANQHFFISSWISTVFVF